MSFAIDIVSLHKKIYSGNLAKLTLPTTEGVVTILAKHMPFVATLTVGEILAVTETGERLNYSIGKGIFSFKNNIARLLIEDVTSADDISEEKAESAHKKALELIAKGVTKEEKIAAHYMVRRSLIDLKIAKKKKRHL